MTLRILPCRFAVDLLSIGQKTSSADGPVREHHPGFRELLGCGQGLLPELARALLHRLFPSFNGFQDMMEQRSCEERSRILEKCNT